MNLCHKFLNSGPREVGQTSEKNKFFLKFIYLFYLFILFLIFYLLLFFL